MKSTYFTSLRLFFRFKYYFFVSIFLSFFSVLQLLFLAFTRNIGTYKLLSILSDSLYYPLVLLLVLDYVYFRKAADSDTEETLDGITGGKPLSLLSLYFVRLSLLLFTQLILFMSLFVFSLSRDVIRLFRQNNLLISYLYNLFLPSLTFLFLSLGLSRLKSRSRPAILLLIVVIFTSPLSTFFHTTYPTKLPIDRVIDVVVYPFSFLYSSYGRDPHPLYGLQIEVQRLYLMAGIALLMMSFLLMRYAKRRQKLKLVISLFLSLLLFIMAYLPSSTYHHNLKWNGVYKDLFLYRDKEGQLLEWKQNKEEDYFVESYALDIQKSRELEVSSKLEVKSEKELSSYVFTLYRGYKVKEIKMEEENFSWTRKDDLLEIKFEKPVKGFSLQLSYQGHHPYYFSNGAACLLPGYFPWYPMAGEQFVFGSYFGDTSYYGYNPFPTIRAALFDVTLSDDKSIISLPKESDGHYKGVTNGLSLLSGLITETKEEKLLAYCYENEAFTHHRLTEEQVIRSLEEEIKKAEEKYLALSGRTLAENNQKYIQISFLGRHFRINQTAIFDDHILFDQPNQLLSSVLKHELLKQHNITPMMHSFVDYLGEGALNDKSYPEYLSELLSRNQDQIDFTRELIQESEAPETGLIKKLEELEKFSLNLKRAEELFTHYKKDDLEQRLYRYSCGDLNRAFESDRDFLDSFLEEDNHD